MTPRSKFGERCWKLKIEGPGTEDGGGFDQEELGDSDVIWRCQRSLSLVP